MSVRRTCTLLVGSLSLMSLLASQAAAQESPTKDQALDEAFVLKASQSGKISLPASLAEVPEVFLHEPIDHRLATADALQQIKQKIATINRVNREKTDAFIETLIKNRSDLTGLPFAMGDSCRLSENRATAFAGSLKGLASIRESGVFGTSLNVAAFENACANSMNMFKHQMGKALMANPPADEAARARIAAVKQVMPAESWANQLQLTSYLQRTTGVDSGATLARLAIFSEDVDVRNSALKALKDRPAQEYTAILVEGLKYPLPAVAQRAGDAMVQLKRLDLAPRLVDVLASPDPRAPRAEVVGGQKVNMVREVVRINHHRNCLLCHPPNAVQSQGKAPTQQPMVMSVLTAEVPIPSENLPQPSPQGGYFNPDRSQIPDILIRIDVTYLRQDFSTMLPVKNAGPWPPLQRFDFVVRQKKVTDQEAQTYRELLAVREPGALSPYHQAATVALRGLTGSDAAPTAEAWRQRLAEIKAQ